MDFFESLCTADRNPVSRPPHIYCLIYEDSTCGMLHCRVSVVQSRCTEFSMRYSFDMSVSPFHTVPEPSKLSMPSTDV